jgi:hypothetical protein
VSGQRLPIRAGTLFEFSPEYFSARAESFLLEWLSVIALPANVLQGSPTFAPQAGQSTFIDFGTAGAYAGSAGGSGSELSPEDSLSVISMSLVSCTNLSSRRSASPLFAWRRRSLKALIF